MCLSRRMGIMEPGEPWRSMSRFQEGADNGAQSSGTARNKEDIVTALNERVMTVFTRTSSPGRYRKKPDSRELSGREEVRE